MASLTKDNNARRHGKRHADEILDVSFRHRKWVASFSRAARKECSSESASENFAALHTFDASVHTSDRHLSPKRCQEGHKQC